MRHLTPAVLALSLFSCAISAAAAAAPRALAQVPRLAQAQAADERIGVGDLDLRWNMSVAQARAATPEKHDFRSGGHLPTRDIYRVSQVVVPNILAKDPHLFTATLYFEKDRLVSFDMTPERDGEEEGYIGHVGSMSQSVDLTVHNNHVFGAAAEKAKDDVTDKARVRANGAETISDLGFQIQFRTWRARGAYYRESLVRGDKAGKMSVLRFQGRLASPFQTPTDKIHNATDREAISRDLSRNFALPAWMQAAMLADPWAFLPPKSARQGKNIGVARFNWGMTGPEILAARLDGVATVRALPGKGNSFQFQVDNLQLRPGSPNGWTLQLWVDKKGLSAFELRPMKEVYTDKTAGYPDEAIGEDFQHELDLHVERVFSIKPGQWWQNSDQAHVRVKSTRTQTTMVEAPGQFVPRINQDGSSGPGGFYTPPSSYPITREYKQFNFQPVTLFFSIKDRAWHSEGNQYRQGYLFNSKAALRMAVVRFQGRREGKPFEPVTGGVVKTRDSAVLIRAIFKNYNVNPGQNR